MLPQVINGRNFAGVAAVNTLEKIINEGGIDIP